MTDCTITLSRDQTKLSLYIPSPIKGGHTVLIPPTLAGIEALMKILQRQGADRAQDKTIGTTASPTTVMVEEWLKHNNPTTTATQRAEAFKEKYGLHPDDIELDLT